MKWNASVKKEIESRLMEKEKSLAEYACKSSSAVRYHEAQEDIRPNFSRDADKIIHSYC